MKLSICITAATLAWSGAALSETQLDAPQSAWNAGAHIGEATVYMETCPFSVKMSPVAYTLRDAVLRQRGLRSHFEAGYAQGVAVAKKLKEQTTASGVSEAKYCGYALRRYGEGGEEAAGLLERIKD